MTSTIQKHKTKKVIVLDPIEGVWQWVTWSSDNHTIALLTTLESWAYVFSETEFDMIESVIAHFQETRGVKEFKIKEVETTTTHYKTE